MEVDLPLSRILKKPELLSVVRAYLRPCLSATSTSFRCSVLLLVLSAPVLEECATKENITLVLCDNYNNCVILHFCAYTAGITAEEKGDSNARTGEGKWSERERERLFVGRWLVCHRVDKSLLSAQLPAHRQLAVHHRPSRRFTRQRPATVPLAPSLFPCPSQIIWQSAWLVL